MARPTLPRRDRVQLRSVDVILTGSEDLLPSLRAAAHHVGIESSRMHVVGPSDDPADCVLPPAGLAVIALRRRGDDPAFYRAFEHGERVRPLLLPNAVCVVVTASPVTSFAPRLERRLAAEVLHQVDAAGGSKVRRTWRSFRMRLGLAALRAAGIRVFRIVL